MRAAILRIIAFRLVVVLPLASHGQANLLLNFNYLKQITYNKLRRVLTTTNGTCIGTYSDLVDAFDSAAGQDSPSFELCEGTITVDRTLYLNASNPSLSCAGSAESCILEKDSSILGRILRIHGNGAKITGIAFKNGQSKYGGGAVLISGTDGFGSVTVQDCAFVGNKAGRDGGALKITRHGCVVDIIDSRFVSNKAVGDGGAVSILENDIMCRSVSSSRNLIGCPLSISGCTFQSNVAGQSGGAVHTNYYTCQNENSGDSNAAGKSCDEFFLASYSNTTCLSIVTTAPTPSPTPQEISLSTPAPTPRDTSFSSTCNTQSWPTCSSTPLTGTACKSLILSDCPSLDVYIVTYDAYVTEDYKTNRVRIFVKDDYVYSTPIIG